VSGFSLRRRRSVLEAGAFVLAQPRIKKEKAKKKEGNFS
jgi:hypothetical protein